MNMQWQNIECLKDILVERQNIWLKHTVLNSHRTVTCTVCAGFDILSKNKYVQTYRKPAGVSVHIITLPLPKQQSVTHSHSTVSTSSHHMESHSSVTLTSLHRFTLETVVKSNREVAIYLLMHWRALYRTCVCVCLSFCVYVCVPGDLSVFSKAVE